MARTIRQQAGACDELAGLLRLFHFLDRPQAHIQRLLGDAEPSSATREIGERLGLVAERLRSIDASALERARPESAKRPREELRAWVLGGSWTEAL